LLLLNLSPKPDNSAMPARLLIIEDDALLNEMLMLHFEDQGFAASGAISCAEGLQQLGSADPDLILLDQQLPDGTGLELLKTIIGQRPDQAVIMMTGQHDLELAIEAIKAGARDFVHKPIDTQGLEQAVTKVLEQQRLTREQGPGPEPVEGLGGEGGLIGRSEAMLRVSKEIALSAESAANVLISGESGTGKEVVARLIHAHSQRPGPFVAINCAAIVDNLLESELFGHEKGAFTGANTRKIGRFEQAADGTLFLDEVGELALPLQAKLLRALQERGFERVGGTEHIESRARIIAATNRDLAEEVRAGRFREDLMYRLDVISLQLPPLRQRKEDIPLLARSLLGRIVKRLERAPIQISDAAMDRLQAHHWPGNVRELENLLTQAAVHVRGDLLTPDLIPVGAPATGIEDDLSGRDALQSLRSLDQVEAEHVQQVLRYTGGHKGRSCEILGISRPALDRKIRKYGLEVPDKR
jgi:DNA-binding NtrC family response regulator